MALNLQDYVAKTSSQLGKDKQSQIIRSRPTLGPAQPPIIVDNNNITSKHTIPSLTHYARISGSSFPDGAGENNNEETGTMKDNSDKAYGERHEIAKIDETRLVGPSGLPALIKSTKDFVPKGEGYEVQFQLAYISWFYLHTCTSLW